MHFDAAVWLVQNKGFRIRLERKMSQTYTRARKFATVWLLRAVASAANGWSGEWLKPTQEQQKLKDCVALVRGRLAGAE